MAKMKEPYTEVPNRLIRSQLLSVYDKVVFCVLASCNPSYPSYQTLRTWTGLSNDRIWKSLKKLEEKGLVIRFPRGRAVEYKTAWNIPPDGKMEPKRFRNTEHTIPPHGTEPFRHTVTKKNKEKEQSKKASESFSNSEEKTVAEIIQMAIERTAV